MVYEFTLVCIGLDIVNRSGRFIKFTYTYYPLSVFIHLKNTKSCPYFQVFMAVRIYSAGRAIRPPLLIKLKRISGLNQIRFLYLDGNLTRLLVRERNLFN